MVCMKTLEVSEMQSCGILTVFGLFIVLRVRIEALELRI